MLTFTAPTGLIGSQSLLSSPYTNQVITHLQLEAADHVAYLAWTQGLTATTAEARALGDLVASGNFTVSGLFGAAQSKTDGAGVDPTNPVPTVTVGGLTIGLSDMMAGGTATTWWTTTQLSGKKLETTYHVREYFVAMDEPEGYAPGWWQEDEPEEIPLEFTITLEGDGTGDGSYDIAIPDGASGFWLSITGDLDKLANSNTTEMVTVTVEGYTDPWIFNGGNVQSGNNEQAPWDTISQNIDVIDLNNDGYISISWTVSNPVKTITDMSGLFHYL